MIHPNIPQPTPDWSLPHRCHCTCHCATLTNWDSDRRRACGCCVGSCTHCPHGIEHPITWHGDQA